MFNKFEIPGFIILYSHFVRIMVGSNDPIALDSAKQMELRKRVKELEDENEQLAYKLEKNNRLLQRLNLEKQYFVT